MSYTPTTWVTGDTVTPTKLNKIEQGLYDAEAAAGSSLIIHPTYSTGAGGVDHWTMDQTANTIINAMASGVLVMVEEVGSSTTMSLIYGYRHTNERYDFYCDNMYVYSATSLNEYPEADGGGGE